MKDIFQLITKYKFGAKYRGLLVLSGVVLLSYHCFVLCAPFLSLFSAGELKHLQTISGNLSSTTVAVVLMLIIIEGQQSIRSMVLRYRREEYKSINNQMIEEMMLLRLKEQLGM